MNEILAPGWAERLTRLRLGIELADALGRPGPLAGLGLFSENVPRPHPVPRRPAPGDAIGLPGVQQNPSGRFAIAFTARDAGAPDRIEVRAIDPSRRCVPRRLSIPVPSLAAVLAADQAHDIDPAVPLAPRACRPLLFPGAGYGPQAGATTIRGRATWGPGGPPVQWARVEATADGAGHSGPWRAHGDDRGEFLLVIGVLSVMQAQQRSLTVDVNVTVHARPVPPPDTPVDSPAGSRRDPLWHLPVERLATLGSSDPVAAGEVLPPGYTATVSRVVTCRRGRPARPLPFVLT
ncbi:MAG TPA: hypothetical protein VFV73_15490 [Streptosporangiaceae bacterium]|nr:hypothetical protein [Streptosporangiaceae bacterium]